MFDILMTLYYTHNSLKYCIKYCWVDRVDQLKLSKDQAPFLLLWQQASTQLSHFACLITDNVVQESTKVFLPPCQMHCTYKHGCGNTSISAIQQYASGTNRSYKSKIMGGHSLFQA